MNRPTKPAVENGGNRKLQQPLDVINIDGALLSLDTVGAIACRSRTALFRDRAAGLLRVRVLGRRCVRVVAEDARAYLAALAQGRA